MMKQLKQNKLSPHYDPEPMSVVARNGTMVIAASPKSGTKTKNISQFKRVHDARFQIPMVEETNKRANTTYTTLEEYKDANKARRLHYGSQITTLQPMY